MKTLLLTIGFVLLAPAVAVAQVVGETSDAPPLPTDQVLPSAQFYALLAGALVPLLTYFINHHAPWASEPVKAIFLVVVAAFAGAVTQLIDAGTLAFDTNTLQVIGTAVLGAIGAHAGLWSRSGISTKLGGGSNAKEGAA